jgi:hypothetical protein
MFLGPQGLIALMHDKLVRHRGTKNYEEIVALVGDALLLLVAVGRELGLGPQPEEKSNTANPPQPTQPARPASCVVCGSPGPIAPATQNWDMLVCEECYAANDENELKASIANFLSDVTGE